VDNLWATKSEDGLIIRAIGFQDFQPMWSWSTDVTDRQTDGQTTSDSKTALCTVVHRAVKMSRVTFPRPIQGWFVDIGWNSLLSISH